MVENPIVWIVAHLLGMIECADICLPVLLRAQVQESVGLWEQSQHQDFVVPVEEVPNSRQE